MSEDLTNQGKELAEHLRCPWCHKVQEMKVGQACPDCGAVAEKVVWTAPAAMRTGER